MIEGVGSNFGLLEELLRPIEGRSFLNCLSDSNEIRYPGYKPSSSCPMLTNSILPIQSPLLFQVYPNPSNGIFNLKNMNAAKNITVEIYNLLGEKIDTFNFQNAEINTIDLRNLNSGVYFVKINDGTQTNTQKINIVK